MGRDKIGRNEPCSCGSGKKYKVCCYLKDFDKKITKGLNYMGDDSYFIRMTNDKEQYIHLEEHNKDHYVYKVKQGVVGACGWHKKEGEAWIKNSGYHNLELVRFKEILGNDGTLN